MADWDEFERSVVVGHGPERLEHLKVRLLGWRVHEAAGLRVLKRPPRVLPGATAHLRVPWLPWVKAPVKVWSVIDEPRRAGFTYTSLPGHPEEGLEEFMLELRDSGEVTFTIRARSRHALWWTRALAPLARAIQRYFTGRYIAAARRM